MDPALEGALRVLQDLLSQAGRALEERERSLLQSRFDSLDDACKRSIAGLYEPLWKGFFLAAAKGQAFLPLTSIKEEFGRSLEENYRGGSQAFLRFAATYWTFKLVHGRLFPKHTNTALCQLLGQLEQDIASVFFPTPGPVSIPVQKREETQRALIRESGAPIDITDFISGNPMLRASRSTGCFGVVIAVVVIASAVAMLVSF